MSENVNKAMKALNKAYPENKISYLTDSVMNRDTISTGSLGLDLALGGGLVRGRVLEILGPESSGKTTLALHMLVEAQKHGIVVYIDTEHALNPSLCHELGIDLSRFIIFQPDYAEQAFEVIEALVETGDVSMVILDSVAGLSPKAEMEGDSGDSNMGLVARLLGQHLRKIIPLANKTKTNIVYINQIRFKIGVLFGCINGYTKVPNKEGKELLMSQIEEKDKVYSYDFNEGKIAYDKVQNKFINGDIITRKDFISIKTLGINNQGLLNICLTPDHKVYTDKGWLPSKELTINHKVATMSNEKINGSLKEFLYGTFCGDSHFCNKKKTSCSFKLQDTNSKYLNWKIQLLKPFFDFKKVIYKAHSKELTTYRTNPTYELLKISKLFVKRNPMEMLNNFTPLSFAIWIMDDGHYHKQHNRYSISIKRLNKDKLKLQEIENKLKELGFNNKINNEGNIVFTVDMSNKIANLISQYIPNCMKYKLPEGIMNNGDNLVLNATKQDILEYVDILEIRECSNRQFRIKHKYDLETKYGNYFIGGIHNGILVHNSPETTSGGNALKFFTSARLDIRRIEKLKEKGKEDSFIGIKSRIKVIKNKMSVPFKECEVDFIFNKGIDNYKELADIAIDKGLITKSGAWFSYNGETIAQGKESLKDWLVLNPEITNKLRKDIFGENDETHN